jgi:hypothetical protein
MSGRKPTPDERKVSIPTVDHNEFERAILNYEIPLRESITPTMQAPEDWPPAPHDVDSDK